MNKRLSNPAVQRGMSLIEMMIAMTLSLIVIGAVSGVYLSTSRSYTQDELLARMQENARYALHVLAEDLSMGGYWGPLLSGENINTTPRSCSSTPTDPECIGLFAESLLSLDSDCGPGTISAGSNWAISIDVPLEVMTTVSSGSTASSTFSCIDSSEFASGSDILVVKRVDGTELASTRDSSDDEQELFVRTDGLDAMIFEYDDDLNASEGPGISDWRYRANIYYIRNYFLDAGDGIPTLSRKILERDDMVTEGGGVAQGIEYFHVMFGIDDADDGDAIANFYTSSPTTAELDNVTSARIYVLARSVSPDPNYVNDKIYRLGDVTRDYSGAPDNFYRRVFTTTVTLRNQRNRISTSGS